MLTGRRVRTKEAAPFLSTIATTPEVLDEQVKAYSDMLLESAPGAMRDIKRLIEGVSQGGDPQRAQRVRDNVVKKAYLNMMQSEEAAYGIMAFVTKKKPDWSTFIKENAKL